MAVAGRETDRTFPARRTAQRRALRVLTATQMLGGIGAGTGVAVSTLIAAGISGSDAIGGLAQTTAVTGAALLAVPMAWAAARRGRRPALIIAYGAGTAGALIAMTATALRWWPLLLVGLFLFGGGTAAGLGARYAATDLSLPGHAGRDLGVVVWATTIGAVAGPNLSQPADDAGRTLGLAASAGPYALAAAAFGLAALGILALLRPDPLLTARRAAGTAASAAPPARGDAWRVLRESRDARVAVAAIVVSHTVMVAVMSMTPVHLNHGHATLTVVGIVVSLHIAGMYALSPAAGWLSDRSGRIPVLLLGMALLITAAALAGSASPHAVNRLTVALVLLGLGWSCGLVAGSAMLTEAVAVDRRPAVQGLSDLMMNGGAALGGLAAGAVVNAFSYAALTSIAIALVIPMSAILMLTRLRSKETR